MFVLYLSWKGFHLFIYFVPGLIFHSEGTVCSSGGIISDRPWTRRPLLVSLALILLSPLLLQHSARLCVCPVLAQELTLHSQKIPFDLMWGVELVWLSAASESDPPCESSAPHNKRWIVCVARCFVSPLLLEASVFSCLARLISVSGTWREREKKTFLFFFRKVDLF